MNLTVALVFTFHTIIPASQISDTTYIFVDSTNNERYFYKDIFENFSTLQSGTAILNTSFPLELWDSKFPISFIVFPNETIRIEAENGFTKLEMGKTEHKNEFSFSHEFYEKFGGLETGANLPSLAFLDDEWKQNTEKRDSLLFQSYSEQLHFLQEFTLQKSLSEQFVSLQKANFRNYYFAKRLMAGYSGFPNEYVQKVLDDFKTSDFENEAIGSTNYRLANRIFLMVSSKLNPDSTILSVIKQFRSAEQRVFATAQTLYFITQKNSFYSQFEKEKDELWYYLKENESQTDYSTYLANLLIDNHLEENELINYTFETQHWENILQKKLTYIDFWATWCGPCVAEMPYYSALQSIYSQKEIAFISISIDHNINNWKQAVEKYKMPVGASFFIGANATFKLIKEQNINKIPRYMLIDASGKIIDANAPRPSDPKIREVLDYWLAK